MVNAFGLILLVSLALMNAPDGQSWLYNTRSFAILLLVAATGLVLTLIIVRGLHNQKQRAIALLMIIAVFSSLTGYQSLQNLRAYKPAFTETYFRQHSLDAGPAIKKAFGNQQESEFPLADNERIIYQEAGWNIGILADVPSANSFISTVSPSLFRFYSAIGRSRFVTSRIYPADELAAALGIRYLLSHSAIDGRQAVGSITTGDQTVLVYENKRAIPWGFPQHNFIRYDEFMKLDSVTRQRALSVAFVFDEKKDALLTQFSEFGLTEVQATDMAAILVSEEKIIVEKQALAANDFMRSSSGFSGSMNWPDSGILYLAVPNDPGWSAYLDGKPVDIIDSIGMMAIFSQAGEHHFEFRYRTPGLTAGSILSGIALIILLLLLFLPRLLRRSRWSAATQSFVVDL